MKVDNAITSAAPYVLGPEYLKCENDWSANPDLRPTKVYKKSYSCELTICAFRNKLASKDTRSVYLRESLATAVSLR